MVDPIRRVFVRSSCDIRAELHSSLQGKVGEGRLIDIGLGGAQFQCRMPLQRQLSYQLRFSWKTHAIDMECRVVREKDLGREYDESRVYGIEFNASSAQEHRLRRFLEELSSPGK